jgi:hypothetical protein
MTDEDRARSAQEVAAMPGDSGWWHTDGDEAFRGLAVEMVGLDVPVDRALRILATAFGVVANEYGG